jgi:hypothetical protein
MLTFIEGAGSADFHRFIHKFYEDSTSDANNGLRHSLPRGGLGRTFYEKLWKWVTTHSDIRIIHNGQVYHYSLTEFETAEQPEATRPVVAATNSGSLDPASLAIGIAQPAESLLALRVALRQRLSAEGQNIKVTSPVSGNDVEERTFGARNVTVPRQPRKMPNVGEINGAVFDDPTSTTHAPRLYASQNRIWQALTGHSIDLKKVPTMEFALLSIIAANGANGITQPDLTHFSGQDKRSVPHRTDELARKGYIVKNPVQAGKARTSLCVHTKFVSDNHFTSSGAVQDVFQEGTFVASGFMQLLYNKLKDAGVVPTREIRKRLVSARFLSTRYH